MKARGERSRFLSPALPLPFIFLSLLFTNRSLWEGEILLANTKTGKSALKCEIKKKQLHIR